MHWRKAAVVYVDTNARGYTRMSDNSIGARFDDGVLECRRLKDAVCSADFKLGSRAAQATSLSQEPAGLARDLHLRCGLAITSLTNQYLLHIPSRDVDFLFCLDRCDWSTRCLRRPLAYQRPRNQRYHDTFLSWRTSSHVCIMRTGQTKLINATPKVCMPAGRGWRTQARGAECNCSSSITKRNHRTDLQRRHQGSR